MADANERRFRRVAWVNVLGNAGKIVVEGSVGILFGSVALIADAAHSVADLVASIVVLGWGDGGYRGPDPNHPHGHARFEPMSALVVGLVIVAMGAVLLYESIEGIRSDRAVTFDPAMLGALAFAILLMSLLYRYTTRENADLGSIALRALAVDCRNDVLTSIAALAGVGGVLLGYSAFDPIAGATVSIFVIVQGISIGRENVHYLLGSGASEAKRREIRRAIMSHADVIGVHDFVVFYEGADLEVEAHVEVDGDMSIRRAHAIESELVREIRGIADVSDVHLHLDPSGIGEWKDASDD